MTNKLREYFPMLRSREEVLQEIQSNEALQDIYAQWSEEQQTEFLEFCTGMRGAKILYDFLFKEIFNPETVPERLEALLGCMLGQEVKIVKILPNDSVRLADEGSLLITDIVVEMADGIANVEIQKIGYAFPGQRSACYSSDLLLRQYKRVRSRKKKAFRYRDIKNVYTIVFFEKSPKEFQQFPKTYIHRFTQKSDTGLELELLQKYMFVSLDIFREIFMEREICGELEAWLAFLGMEEPEKILELIQQYPEFRPLYAHIYDMCRNVEGVMGLFSKELRQLDRNTVQYMIDEMQEEIERKDAQIAELKRELEEQKRIMESQT